MTKNEHNQFHHTHADNNFFTLFLDGKYKIYSCGVWDNATTLEQAQENKLKRMADFANIQEGDHVLDIGCGWGGMLEYCMNIRKTGGLHGITLSNAEYNYIVKKYKKRIPVNVCSWADLRMANRFDALVSMGAMKYFASSEDRKNGNHINVYQNFFKCCYHISTMEACLGLETIILLKNPNTTQSTKDIHYLQENVLAGSTLPEMNDLYRAMHKLYEPLDIKKVGQDYSLTLREWKKRLNAHQDIVLKTYGEDLLMHYNHYFDAAIRSFEQGYLSLLQMSLKKTV